MIKLICASLVTSAAGVSIGLFRARQCSGRNPFLLFMVSTQTAELCHGPSLDDLIGQFDATNVQFLDFELPTPFLDIE